jgi:hypothetical protein
MYEPIDELSDTFMAYERLAPDGGDVLERVNVIARGMRRRRWAVRATGASVLGVGLVAGSVALPGLARGGGSSQTVKTVQAADGSASASPSPTAGTYTDTQALNEYFADGYDYNNAEQLAQIWGDSSSDNSIQQVKTKAGMMLLEGQKLPVAPDNTPESATPEDAAQAAFFAAGYDYNDAVQLAALWKETNVYHVKIEAGQKLLDGQTLPIPPSGSQSSSSTMTKAQLKAAARAKEAAAKLADGSGSTSTPATSESPALSAYFAAGYDYNDAVSLGQIWNETDITQIKTDAGQKLLDGDTLPIPPSGTPESPPNKAVSAFFAAGYDYNDAVKLAKLWNETDTYQVKIEAGKKLLDGQTLPISP